MEILFLGRSKKCDVVLNHSSVSSEHAQLLINDGKYEIIDLNSTNGTYVNGIRIANPVIISSTDQIRFGEFDYDLSRFLIGDFKSIIVEPESSVGKDRKLWVLLLTLAAICVVLITFYLFDGGKENLDSNQKEKISTSLDSNTVDTPKASNDELNPKENSVKAIQKDEEPLNVESIEPGSVEYDFNCLNQDDDMGTTSIFDDLSTLEKEILGEIGSEVTIKEEMDLGKELLAEIEVKDFGTKYNRIKAILKKLKAEIPNNTKFRYQIHFVNENEINAFTCGGQIFVFKGIIDFCKDDDELAAIIAHEIAHNELGHINSKMTKLKTSTDLFGEEIGELTTGIYLGATSAFGQKEETHCDLYGIDLAFKAGYDACKIVGVWKRMDDEAYNVEGSILRSHPFSSQRSSCCSNHINNYHINKCR